MPWEIESCGNEGMRAEGDESEWELLRCSQVTGDRLHSEALHLLTVALLWRSLLSCNAVLSAATNKEQIKAFIH